MTDQKSISRRYLLFLESLERISTSCARKRDDIQLVVVTKGQSVEKINEVMSVGAENLGENYPEETVKKVPQVTRVPIWHMIGHLQSRKIKHLLQNFSMIHSIDRSEIAKKLDDALAEENKTMRAMFEVNLSGESSKSGFPAWDQKDWPNLLDSFNRLSCLEHLKFVGLMTMPPFTENPEDSRPVFQKCRSLLELCQHEFGWPEFKHLSMGTSLDYPVAIQEGATFIRIGEAIMGERSYQRENWI